MSWIDGCDLCLPSLWLFQFLKRQEELFTVPGKSGFAAVCLLYEAAALFKMDTGTHVKCSVDRQDIIRDTLHNLESHVGFLLVLVS